MDSRPARGGFGWPTWLSRRGVSALAITAAVVIGVLIPVLMAQVRRPGNPTSPVRLATRALIEGRYDEVATLTASLDQQDPVIAALKSRALTARGRYQEAEALLRPIAARAPTSEAALQLGLLLQMLTRPEADSVLTGVVATVDAADRADDAAQLARAGRALRALGRHQEANAAYRDAAALLPQDPSINTAWGDLFLEKYNNGEALKSYQAALQADPKWAPAMLGMARVLADENPPQAVAMAGRALEINPSDVDTHVFLALQALDAGNRDEARATLQKAFAVNPSSVDARALLAGIAYVEDKAPEFQSEVAKALTVAPRDGEVYRVAGEQASHNYRFDEAVDLVRRGLALEPGDPQALGELGTHLLRTGDEPGAREALEASFKLDPFNIVTYNLLQMMDTLDTFVTVRDGDLVIRMHKDEAPVLQDYIVGLAHQALTTLSAKYQFTPKGPFLIEMFPKHDDFAVRNVGLPGMIGALGACFGRVVTLDSPRARPPGEFQWEATLWHELAHVITIQMSNQRVPRWLTEGISVYEEKLARPEWGRGQEIMFAQMLNAGEAMTVRDLNAAFTDPKKISIAYFEASLLVDHIVRTYGDAGLHRLLRAYGQGLEKEEALKAGLNTDFDQLQASFDKALEQSFGALRQAVVLPDKDTDLRKMTVDGLREYAAQHPGSFIAQVAYAGALRKAGNVDDAVAVLRRAATLAPVAAGPDSPHAQLAEIALERKDRPMAIRELRALLDVDFDNIAAARKLAGLLKEEGATDAAMLRPVYERIVAIDPFDADAHTVLGRLAMQRNDAAVAVREFKAAVAIGPVDQAGAHTDLAESYFVVGKRVEAKKETLAALEIAPSYVRAQELLLKLAEARP